MANYRRLVDSLLGMRDWDRVVRVAKEIIQSHTPNPQEALRRMFSFLDELEIKRALEQAREEIEGM